MKISRKIVFLPYLVLISFILTSASKLNPLFCQSINYNIEKKINIAVLLYDLNNSFMKEISKSLVNIQNEKNDLVKFSIYDGKNNISVQNQTLDSLKNTKLDLIVAFLADTREDTVNNFIEKAKDKNIPLILLSISPEIAEKVSNNYNKVAFLLISPKNAGTVEGQIIADMWNKNKNQIDKNKDDILEYIMIKGKTNDVISDERSNSAISAINNSGIKTKELQTIYSDWSRESTKITIQNLILKYGNRVEAIISNNDDMAIGALEGIQIYGYNTKDDPKNIPIVGIGGTPDAKELVNKGLIGGTVIQDAKELADGIYAVGMNLINHMDPLNNTSLKMEGNEIMILQNPKAYTKDGEK